MNRRPRSPRPGRPGRLRWLAAPLLAATILGAYAVLPSLASTGGSPPLPPISARDLVARVERASVPGLSGTISSSPRLGLPDLGAVLGDRSGLLTPLLTGSHTLTVWQAGTDVRLSLPSTLAEDDFIRHGRDVWVWSSDGQQARHLTLTEQPPGQPARSPAEVAPTPQALADHFLGAVDPSTRVSVGNPVTVAGRDAYQLVLAPRSATTLVSDVAVAVDAATGVPLRVQVSTKGSADPALDVGFSSVDFSLPSPSQFAFTPPPGAKVTEARSPVELLLPSATPGASRPGQQAGGDRAPGSPAGGGAEPRLVGQGWDAVAVVDLGSDAGARSAAATLRRLGSRVSGPWGSGELVHTALVNVLLTDGNTLLAGSVPEAALEAVAAGH